MDVICPACSKQHRVSDQMAGKRAKCGCGEVMTIPAAPAAELVAEDWINTPSATFAAGPIGGVASSANAGEVLFECEYGLVRPSMWCLFGVTFVIALALIPIGIFWNDGWQLNINAPLPPWLVMVICESLAIGLLLGIAYLLIGYFLNGRRPQRVAITAAGVILPKNKLSTEELFIPWARVKVKHWGGPADHLYFKHGFLRTSQITSVQFPTDEDFAEFFDHLRERDKV